MLDNPTIVNYKPFYIQYGNNATASNTLTTWGLIAKSNPYPALPSPKDPYKNDWLDENGDEEYTTNMKYQSFEFSVDFCIRAKNTMSGNNVTQTAEETIRTNMATFFTAIKSGEFKIYDSYTGLGRQKVRYAGFEEDAFISRRGDGGRAYDFAYCCFKVKFKVNDPLTFMKLQNNAIVAIV